VSGFYTGHNSGAPPLPDALTVCNFLGATYAADKG